MQIGKVELSNMTGNIVVDEWYFWDKTLTAELVMEVYQAYRQGKMNNFNFYCSFVLYCCHCLNQQHIYFRFLWHYMSSQC